MLWHLNTWLLRCLVKVQWLMWSRSYICSNRADTFVRIPILLIKKTEKFIYSSIIWRYLKIRSRINRVSKLASWRTSSTHHSRLELILIRPWILLLMWPPITTTWCLPTIVKLRFKFSQHFMPLILTAYKLAFFYQMTWQKVQIGLKLFLLIINPKPMFIGEEAGLLQTKKK